ncbi:MAG: D-alanyl-D-alanine carboxypeptidase family protein [Gammaproteobacteria bacterium]|nr:D-alanyl-D-alanine carboxypeptidase family protein [Gammaproteobacteria bacterium]
MRAILFRIFTLILSVTFFSATALADSVIPIPSSAVKPIIINPAAPNLDVKSYILMDADSGKILAEKDADLRLPPASLTKLMTMYVISDALKNGTIRQDDKVRISEKAWKTGGSRMFVKVNDEVPVQELLKGIVIASGNDAAVAMAEHLAGTESAFADLMNTHAQQLGMKNSHFVDSNGLPNPDHYATARDLAILARAIIQQFPDDYKLYSEKWFAWNNIRQPNRNRLLWHFPEADGLKTGHTSEAGFCLVGSAKKDSTRLISVVMGAKSDQARTEDSIRLLTYGFRFYETHKIYSASTALTTVRVWKGKDKEIDLGLADDLFVTLPAGQYKNIQAKLTVSDPLKAPIKKDQPCGTLTITLNDQVLATQPLIALSNNARGNLWRSVSDSINFSVAKFFTHSTDKVNSG